MGQRGVAALTVVLIAATASLAQVTIDNDIPIGTVGHWSVYLLPAGESHLATVTAQRHASHDVFTENVLYDYYSYVDVGSLGNGFRLSGSGPVLDPSNPDAATSSGHFTGEYGNNIQWTVRSSIEDRTQTMVNTLSFRSADGGPLGRLRFLQYMDEDVQGVGDDVFFVRGTIVGRNLELFTMDNIEVYGVSHSGALDTASGLFASHFSGWAADQFNNIQPRIIGAGQQVSLSGVIQNLSLFGHNELGPVYGPRDIVSVLAWDVDPTAAEAVVVTTLGGAPDTGSAFEPPIIDPPGARQLLGALDPSRPTIVLTHGLQLRGSEIEDLWTGAEDRQAIDLIRESLGDGADNVNIVQYIWQEAFQPFDDCWYNNMPSRGGYISARNNTIDAGRRLASELIRGLGVDYSRSIHFIGHSLGTIVNSYAAASFLAAAQNVRLAQFTALDRPDHISPICDVSDDDERQFGYHGDFFASVLPLCEAGLEVRAENYYSRDGAGVGDVATGHFYNHAELVNPNDLDDRLFPDEGASNNHSGVHQWYRWTILPNDPILTGETVCDGPAWAAGRRPSGFDDSLNPCARGWGWSLNALRAVAFPPVTTGCPFDVSDPTDLDISECRDFGCSLEVTESVTRFVCGEQGVAKAASFSQRPSFGVADVLIPENATYLEFEYGFVSGGDGEYAVVYLDDVPLWMVSGRSVEGDRTEGVRVPIGLLTGARRLTVALYSAGMPDGRFVAGAFRTRSLPLGSPPIADAGPDQSAECGSPVGTRVSLDGTRSFDPDGDTISYSWTGQFVERMLATPAPEGTFGLGDTVVTLVVSDGRYTSEPDTSIVTIRDTLAPAGGVTVPKAGTCHPDAVTVCDDYVDACDADLWREYEPGPGPTYAEHGDHSVALTIHDASGNQSQAVVDFTIDRHGPSVTLRAPSWEQRLRRIDPISDYLMTDDTDGAAGGVVGESLLLDDCVLLDGRTYGDGDGLLADDSIEVGGSLGCRIWRVCGRDRLEDPVLRAEARDCAGNLGQAEIRLQGSFAIDTARCR